jgi:amino acid adenylation domain-containing protein
MTAPGDGVLIEDLVAGPPSPEGVAAERRRRRGEVEADLARIVAEVLERREVESDQDVFALGADSLRAVQLLARVHEAFGVEISLEELFAAPTVGELAALVEGAGGNGGGGGGAAVAAGGGPPLTRRQRGPGAGPLPLSFAQRRLWFLHQLEPRNPVHNLAAAVRLEGRLSVPALAAVFAEMVRRHEALRTGFTAAGEEPAQVVRAAAPVPLPVVDLSALPRRRRQRLARGVARELARLPFDLERGQVIRAALLRLAAGAPGIAGRQAGEAGEVAVAGEVGGGGTAEEEVGGAGTAGDEHELVLALHHIAADGGSLAVLAGELAALYGAFAGGRPSSLPELPVQYADYALWQRRRLTEAALAPGLAWWRERLAGEPPPLELPADRPRPAVLSHRGAHYERPLGAALAGRLETLARELRATPFMALLAGFAALLHRYSGQTDLVIGTPVGGRDRVELEGLIGVFLNNLVLRVSLAGEPGLRELLARTREAALGAFAHQEVPFERLVDELRPGRDLSRTPLFQVIFVGQNAPLRPLALPGLRLRPHEVDLGTARFDLAVSMAPVDGGWSGTWKLSTDLFDVATVARLASHLENLLAAALAEPHLPVARLAMLSPGERHQVLGEWNDTGTDWPAPETWPPPLPAARPARHCLHELIGEQAARTPAAVAVEDGAEQLTYEELLGRAGALAARLRALGVAAESRVAVFAERSAEMVVGLLGTLEAGGAYVPLDPDYPAERLAYMLADSGVEALLVQARLLARLGPLPERLRLDGRVLDLGGSGGASGEAVHGGKAAPDGQAAYGGAAPVAAAHGCKMASGAKEAMEAAAGGPAAEMAAAAEAAPGAGMRPRAEMAPGVEALPDSPAYAIYTSGSTGKPKGAVVPQRGIVNRLLWMQEAYRLGPDDRVLQKTPFSFDVSVWEFFWPLLAGARLVMAPPGAHQDPARLAALIQEHRITTLHFVPSMLQVFVEQPGLAAACGSVRRVFASGEALPFELKERFLARLPGVELHNLYGPTEASVDVTFHACRRGGDRQLVPIGRPIANTSILLLDRQLAPVPAGVPGELHIGGVGLARGYLGRPELTAEQFIPDPFGGRGGRYGWRRRPGARLYKTGDLARFRPDGEIEFLGRLDHQVKVRGVRIELGEIEAALARHPEVREAVVLARRDPEPGAPAAAAVRLVAYLVPAGGAAPEAGELRAFLRLSLPEAMVPAAFVALPAFPLTGSGKVDRRALPAPAPSSPAERSAGAPAYEEPGTALERRLAALWREVLGVERVGRHDNFFELGGDSIQGAMLVNRIQRELGQIVYVMALFDAPTLARFAAYLAAGYPEAAARLAGESATAPSFAMPPVLAGAPAVAAVLDELRAAVARRLGRAARLRGGRNASAAEAVPRNPAAVFLLSPFRSGSTLLRVMLAGHSRLFAPPELELLAFATLGERRRIFSGRNRFAREGLLRAVMELRGCDADEAERIVGAAEDEDLPVASWYRRLQQWSGGRLLVDKTPSYSLDPATLARAERLFERPLYVHLVRHPVATVESYVEARMDRVYEDLPFAPAAQAQLVWLLAHDNILRFLDGVPAERQRRLRFEDLLREPHRQMAELGRFLGVGFEPAMLEPYSGRRMTDGPRSASRMMGDPKFHQHQGIDAAVAERSRVTAAAAASLAVPARELAARLGYDLPAPSPSPALPPPAPAAHAGATGTAPVAIDGAAGPAPREGGLTLLPVPRDGGMALPLSFSQERLWFLSQLDPQSPAYNMPAAVRLLGRLDVPALGRSFAEVLRRHEVLRTRFPAVQGRPVQRIAPPQSVADEAARLPVVDLTALAEAAREAERRRLALAEGRRPFDLARGPMLRTVLLALAPPGGMTTGSGAGRPPGTAGQGGEHVLLVTLHHVVSDGWTVGVLMRELSALYRAFAAGRPSPLPPLPLQYADYAYHQRRWLEGATMAAHLAYWRRRLAGRLPPLELPTDRPRPTVQTSRGARLSRTLSAAATGEIRAFGTDSGATFFLALLAAWNALLHRYTAQEDLLLGIPIANRNRLEVESLIGVFLNMVVQRTDAAGDPPFARLLAGVKEGFLGSIPHQEVPFERLVEDLKPPRDLSRAPIFQVQFSLQNTPSEPLALPGLAVELLDNHNRTTKFDITVFLFDLPGGLTTTLEYNADLFDEATMARLLAHWETMLAGAVAAPGARLSELPLLAAAERRALLAGWNDPVAEFPAGPSLHHLFAAQAARRPGAVAAVHEVEELTYARLDERANRLAHRLRALGVGPEVRVGLCVERSLDMLVGLLGILKAGGAYVPLDPAYPPERLAWILEDALRGCASPVLVTEERLVPRFQPVMSEGRGAAAAEEPYRLVLLDAERAALARESAAEPPALPGAGADNAAYVIYTSGSTGKPKGVVVPHAQVVRLFRATEPWFGFGPDDVWTLFHSYAFDFSVWEIWGALLYGGRLVVVPREASLSPPAFYDLLASEGVTVLNQTPSVFRQLVQVDAEEGGRLAGTLRRVIFGGEALELQPLAPFIARHGDRRPALVNMYGITETTVHVTYRPLRAADLQRTGASPVGAPLPDLQVHLLGRRQELLPVGVPGEIHVGGAGLARGYLGRPELTAERFVPDPFSRRPGARLYRSGDLARRRPDGDLDYLGRIDGQVKIRGFRIELGEIESALDRHPGVREGVVEARGGLGGDRRLVAWVVPSGAPVPAAELREHLLRTLPDYMVPAAFVSLDRLPLTSHGKVDRRALPEPEAAAGRPAKAAPRSLTEARLAAIWRQVLRVEEIGAGGNFFELGGHSLLVAQLASRIRTQFGVELPLRALFEAPTLAGLAARLDELLAGGSGGGSAEERIPRLPRGGHFPLSFAQERLWFLDRFEPGSTAYNIAIALRLSGRLDLPAFAAALRALVRRHESLRTTFVPIDGVPRQVIAADLVPALPIVDLTGLDSRREPPLAAREAAAVGCLAAAKQRPFDLERGPLIRVLLVRVAGDDWRALCELHHIVGDGWSNDVLVRELGEAYAALAAGLAPPWTALPIQYADFAAWQRQRLAGEALAAQLTYWRQRLAGVPPLLELPADRPRPAVQRYRGRVLRRQIGADLLHRVAALCRGEAVTLFMGLLAGFGALLHRATDRSDVLIGTPVAGRDLLELEGLVGLFVNSLALRLDLDGEAGFRQALAQTREVTLGAFAHQELPFDKLVEELSPRRSLGHAPVFQVMLILQNPQRSAFSLPELEVGEVPLEGTTAQLDLTLDAREEGGQLLLRWVYDRDLFDAATLARLSDHLRQLLAGAVADPDRRLAELPLLTPAERAVVLEEWNDSACTVAGHTIHELFAAQAARTPAATAVVHGGEALTYGELDRRANRLARHLLCLGLWPEGRAGVCLERSLDMVVALLGILKAGGAYVPLDPAYPRQRLATIAEDARLAMVIAAGELADAFAGEVPIVRLDADRAAIAAESAGDLPALDLTDPLAYLIYTSGSTGKPKGVMIGHRNVLNFFAGMDRVLSGGPGCWLAVTSISFDISVLELLWTLCRGFKVVVQGAAPAGAVPQGAALPAAVPQGFASQAAAPPGAAQPGIALAGAAPPGTMPPATTQQGTVQPGIAPQGAAPPAAVPQGVASPAAAPPGAAEAGLPEQIRLHAVTHLQCTPSLASALRLDPDAAPALARLRQLLLGGEPLPPPLAADLGRSLTGPLLNMYGPTETTVWSSTDRVDPGGGAITLGRPIANTRLYVADRRGEPAPIGWPGELAIAGEGVARGYWDRPELTAEKFLPDPWSPCPGDRLYRTGDLVRRLPDGRLGFLGRIDHQVKIRGYRIELGEIEAVLGRHPRIAEAVVVAHEAAPGDTRLVAYFAAREAPPPELPEPPDLPEIPEIGEREQPPEVPEHPQPSEIPARPRPVEIPAGIPELPQPSEILAHPRPTEILAHPRPMEPPGLPQVAELRAWLSVALPDYMVPARFVALSELPRLPNGKVDRRALPEPPGEIATGAARLAPRNRTEAKLAAIWREVLRLDEVGVEDDFFALGGHSLLAAQVLSRAGAALGLTLPLRSLFETPTIAGLAATVQGLRAGEQATAAAPPIRPLPRPAEVPLSYAQERLWFVEQLEGGAYSMPAAVRLRGELDVAALAASLREIVRRHEALRTRFAAVAGRPVQVIDPWSPALARLPLVDLEALPKAEAAAELDRLSAEDEERAFDLARGPLLRSTLALLGEGDFLLLFNMHHVVSDGWSQGVLLHELAALYRAFERGRPSPLPALPVQYADFALWQREWLRGEVLDGQLRYWTGQLAGAAPLALPADRPPVAGQIFAAGEIGLEVAAELTAGLHALARRQGASLFMVLLAAFQALLHRLSGQDDVAVGTPVANRDWAEIEGLIGFFVNTLVLRTGTAGKPSFRELLQRVRETTLGAYDHQDLPFARVVEALRPDRGQGRQPLFDVMFTLQNQPMPEVELPGLRLELVQREGRAFGISVGLSLRIWEANGRLVGGLGYNTARFDRATALRWSSHWLALLAAIAAEPQLPIDELPLLGDGERHQLLVEWGGVSDGGGVSQGGGMRAEGAGGGMGAGRGLGAGRGAVVLHGDLPAPIGVWGEVARLRPDGTLERTGERARRRMDGSLEAAPPASGAGALGPAGTAVPAGAAAAAAAGQRASPGEAAAEIHQSVAQQRAELSSRLDTLSAAKRELLEKRLRKLAAGGQGAAAPRPRGVKEN